MTAPDALYLEQWPEEANRDDRIFYAPTGYGEDGNGNTSTITVYVRVSLAENPTPQTARVAFKGWTLEAQQQFLRELRLEHAYSAGASNAPFSAVAGSADTDEIQAEWAHGRAHYAERKAQIDSGERGELQLKDSDGKVTWDFAEDDVGFDRDQLAARRTLRERLCAEPVVEVAALEGESSGRGSEPYWYVIYLRDRAAEVAIGLSVGTIQCASGRPTEQAILAALTRWRPGPEYRLTKIVAADRAEVIPA